MIKKIFKGVFKVILFIIICSVGYRLILLGFGFYNQFYYKNMLNSKLKNTPITYLIDPVENTKINSSLPVKWIKNIEELNKIVLNPGDSVLFAGGQTFQGTVMLDDDDFGAPDKPIYIGSFGDSLATLDAGNGYGILAKNTAGIHIARLKVMRSGKDSSNNSGICFINNLLGNVKLKYIKIDSVETWGFEQFGIEVSGKKEKSGFEDIEITNSKVHNNKESGIYIQGIFNYLSIGYAHKNVIIKHVFAYDNSGKDGPEIPNTGSGIIISDTDNGLIERCVAYHNGWLCNSLQGGPVGIWAWDSNNITIQYNESYNNKTNGKKDGGGFDLDGGMKNSVMQYNYSHDNDGHGYLLAQFPYARKSYNNVVRFNISQNDGRKNRTGGIYFWGDFRNTEVYNNTVYMDVPPSVDSIKPTPLGFEFNYLAPSYQNQLPSKIKILNNIFITTPELNIVQVFDDIEDLVLKNNNYFKTDSTFSVFWKGKIFQSMDEWRKATHQEVEGANIFGFNLNPQCRKMGKGQTINNADSLNALTAYDLLPNSPLINKGLNIADFLKIKNPAFDYTGKKVPIDGKFDLGAVEFDINLN